jgi:transcriptional regulator with XRE-family HTH domain
MTKSRFHAVNSKLLRNLRRRVGWSQAELGKRAGYCERVIRKAEAGGSLSMETIENLAQTFSNAEIPISTKELIYSEELLARTFVESYDGYGVDMLAHCGDFLAPDFVFNVPAQKSVLQLAGVYNGKEEFQTFLNRFFSFFTRRPSSLATTYLTGEGRVAAQFEDTLCFYAHQLPPIWVNVHFFFRDGLISRIDQQFDYLTTVTAIEEIRQKLGLGETMHFHL